MNKQIFISYSISDKEMADTVCVTLENAGWKCWLAPRDIVAGSDWSEAIIDAISDSALMVLIYSESAGNSVQIKREVERAANKNVTIVPFRIENTPVSKSLEYFLSTSYWLDALKPPLEIPLQFLVEVVEKLIGRPEEKPSIPNYDQAKSPPPAALPRKRPKRSFLRSRAGITAAIVLLAIFAGGIYLAIARPWSDSASFDTHRNLCQRYLDERQFDLAIEEGKKAVEKEPLNPLGHRALGVAYHSRAMAIGVPADMPRAIDSLSESIRLDPTDTHALYMRGLSYNAQGDYSNGLKDFAAALDVGVPGDQRKADIYHNCGIAYFALKDNARSLKMLNAAIDHDKRSDFYLTLNRTLYEMGKYQEAAERLTEAIDLDPSYRGLYILYNERGKAYSKLKMDKEALADFQKYNQIVEQAQSQNNADRK